MNEQNTATVSQVPLTPEEMLQNLRMGKKMVYEIQMGNQTIPMRVLSMDEEAAVRREGFKQAAQNGGDENDKNVMIQKATIRLATTMGKGQAPFIGDILLNRMTTDEHTYLYNEYINIRDRVNPNLEQIDGEEFQALVECLKKNVISSRDCSIKQLRAICTSFQDLIQRQETVTSPQDR